jgi:hypothetical protein
MEMNLRNTKKIILDFFDSSEGSNEASESRNFGKLLKIIEEVQRKTVS